MPKLHFSQPELAVPACDLPEGQNTVGRSSRNRLVLNDASVSASHCELWVNGNEVIVRDLGSSNGTWVAGVRVDGQRPANHGDVIRFGRIEARLELDSWPDDDSTAVTANIAASRFAKARANPESFRKVIGGSASHEDTHNPTVTVPAPAKPEPLTHAAKPQPALANCVPNTKPRSAMWLKLALLGAGVVTAAWLLRGIL